MERSSRIVQRCKKIIHAMTAVVIGMVLIMEMLRGLGYEPYQILTGSMEPTLSAGEIVLINTNDCDAEEGEVIAFWMGEHVVIHRVKEVIPEGGYKTKGDANATEDFAPINQAEVIGTLWMKLGRLTWVWEQFSSMNGIVFLLGLMFLNISIDLFAEKQAGKEVGYV